MPLSYTRFRRAREHTRSVFHRTAKTIDPCEPLANRRSHEGVTQRASIAHPFARDSPQAAASSAGLGCSRARLPTPRPVLRPCARLQPEMRAADECHRHDSLGHPRSVRLPLSSSFRPRRRGVPRFTARPTLRRPTRLVFGALSSPIAEHERPASDAPVASPFSPDLRAARGRGPARPRPLPA